MKCRHFFSFVLVAFLSLFFGSFIITNNTFALDDLVLSNPPSSTSLRSYYNYWSSCDHDCASQYNYLKIEFLDSNGDSPVFSSRSGAQYIIICGTSFNLSRLSDQVFFLNKSCSSTPDHTGFIMNANYGGNIATSTLGYRFTLTDNLSSCPVCEECQVCPVIPENPYDDKLDNITHAIYVCGSILLVLYFFYCIYRLIIKNSGVH